MTETIKEAGDIEYEREKESMSCQEQVVIVIPSLNPDEKLISLVQNLRKAGFVYILLVNDGSRADCTHYFETAVREYGCRLYTHSVNLGKGRALKSAFNLILNEYPQCIGAVTVDSDGQHTMEDTLAVAKALVEHPDSLIMGCRNFKEEGIPKKNQLGNICTVYAVRLFCGIRVSDTQTGLRGISVPFMRRMMTVKGERFEYELNMLIEAKESGVPLFEVPIHTIYIENNKTSHFNPLLDSIRIYSVFLKFILSSLSSFVVDILLFSLFTVLLRQVLPGYHIVIATVGARVVSSLFNFVINKHNVFKNTAPSAYVLLKYIVLCVVQVSLSAGLVWTVFQLLRWNETLIKVIVDFILFLFSFQIQREWVFKEKKNGRRPRSA